MQRDRRTIHTSTINIKETTMEPSIGLYALFPRPESKAGGRGSTKIYEPNTVRFSCRRNKARPEHERDNGQTVKAKPAHNVIDVAISRDLLETSRFMYGDKLVIDIAPEPATATVRMFDAKNDDPREAFCLHVQSTTAAMKEASDKKQVKRLEELRNSANCMAVSFILSVDHLPVVKREQVKLMGAVPGALTFKLPKQLLEHFAQALQEYLES